VMTGRMKESSELQLSLLRFWTLHVPILLLGAPTCRLGDALG
jgi:hypothetical protein